jgi:GNAT superfamily N-acetyltransferase
MEIRPACASDADQACAVVRRSIAELCHADHQGDPAKIDGWLANKTAENMRRWIAQSNVFVAVDHDRMLGVGSVTRSGLITLNYVAPEARWRGVSKALLRRLEQRAAELGVAAVRLHSTATAHRFYAAAGYRDAEPSPEGSPPAADMAMTKSL